MTQKSIDENLLLFEKSHKPLSLIKSPLNYIGGKYKLLKQIIPLFPNDVDLFIDLFAGGCNVGINADAQRIWFNDNLVYLIDMYNVFKSSDIDTILNHIERRISEFDLSLTNAEGYKQLRSLYNSDRNPLDLFVLIAFTFNHQIRFNNSHEFNNPFGKERSSFNSTMKRNLEEFVDRLHSRDTKFTNLSFEEINFNELTNKDFIYCDPPYLITTGSYNDGKRGFKGWGKVEELNLLKLLDKLNKRDIRFGLSNVIEHKGKSNDLLKNWLDGNKTYKINYLDKNYANSNYHTKNRDKNSSVEVLITNY